jgi:FkbM family methyltransferase
MEGTQQVKEWRGWKFPDGETHLIGWMNTVNDVRHGRPTYQAAKYDEALSHCRKRRRVLDVGANIGLWSWLMAHDFDRLEAFEPVSHFAECWLANVAPTPRAELGLNVMALGAAPGRVSMVNMTPGSCGDTTVDIGQGGETLGEVEMRTLDSFGFEDVDLIKCDNEGFELFVMQGAVETLKRCRPVVIVEQKPGHGAAFGLSDTAAVAFLESLGMRLQRVMSGDYILKF